ncbi:MAG: hypothetical protein M3407_04960 [Acidobacteriota bacterium]|nr:hypothetical protein [Acidobacteriota bacterium]
MSEQLKISLSLPLALLACVLSACSREQLKTEAQEPARQVATQQPSPPAAAPQATSSLSSPAVQAKQEPVKGFVKMERGLQFIEKRIEEKNEKYKYRINFTYPQLQALITRTLRNSIDLSLRWS